MFRSLLKLFGMAPEPKPDAAMEDLAAYQALEELAPRADQHSAQNELTSAQDTLICREAILDRAQRVAGYQFTLRPGVIKRIRVGGSNVRRLYDRVVLDHLIQLKLAQLLGGRFAFVEVDASTLLESFVPSLPLPHLVLAITADSASTNPELLQRMDELRKQGLRLGLVHANPLEAGLEQLLYRMDFFVADLSGNTELPMDLLNVLFNRWPDLQILTRGIDAYDSFETCHRWQQQMFFIHYFQGAFITRKESWHQSHIAPGKLSVLQLMNQLQQGAELNDLAKTMRQDSLLIFKLLRYVNSPAGGLSQPVQTIEQGILVLGRERLSRWLGVLLFSAGESLPGDSALLDNALIRGRLAELLAEDNKLPRPIREQLFMTGMFSLLDRILRVPMEALMEEVNLPDAIRDALLEGKGPYADWLRLVEACEDDAAENVEELATRCGVRFERVNIKQLEAILWAQEVQA